MSITCDSLVRSRWVPPSDSKIGSEVGYWKRLKEPEPCGRDAMRYKVRRAARVINHQTLAGEFDFGSSFSTLPASQWVETNFCDRHKRKALSEGMEVVPA